MAEKNIPFIIENHDGIDFIIYDESDISDIIQIINKIGIIDDLVKRALWYFPWFIELPAEAVL
ncbi:MAG: hypothetical protein GY870_19275 [archaeon]|nr:hypothetical protein [archaeon]